MPGPGDKKRSPTFADGDERRDRRRSLTAGTTYAPQVEVSDEITGRYEGEELEAKRAEREARARERLATLEAQRAEDRRRTAELERTVDTQGKLIDHLNVAHEIAVKPLIEKLPDNLNLIRAAQANLDAALEAAISSSDRAVAEMARQLQDHNVRLSAVERKSDADGARIAGIERTTEAHAQQLAEQRGDIAKLKRARDRDRDRAATSTDAKIGGFVRRHGPRALLWVAVAIGTAVTGAIGGYLSRELAPAPAPALPYPIPPDPAIRPAPPKGPVP